MEAEVIVLTCAPNFPHGKLYTGYKNRLCQTENMDGIKVVRVWSFMTANKGVFLRTIDYISFAISAFCAGLAIKSDVVIASSPQFFPTFSAYGLSKLKRVPWIFELRDLWPDSIAAVGAIKFGRVLNFIAKIEWAFYRDASHIVALTPAFKRVLVEGGINVDKISIITNGVDPDKFRHADATPRDRDLPDLSGKFVIGYIGTHGMVHALDFIIRAAGRVLIKLVKVGGLAARAWLGRQRCGRDRRVGG